MIAEQSKKIDNMQADLSHTRTDLNQTKTDLTLSIADQTKTIDAYLKKGIEDAVAPLAKRQDDLEAKSDNRMSKLEDQVSYLVNLTNPNLVASEFPPLRDPMPSHLA